MKETNLFIDPYARLGCVVVLYGYSCHNVGDAIGYFETLESRYSGDEAGRSAAIDCGKDRSEEKRRETLLARDVPPVNYTTFLANYTTFGSGSSYSYASTPYTILVMQTTTTTSHLHILFPST